ncbi:hypothetical protein N875_03085 [Neisseria meningitidis LNP21362]|uniref:Uncharacterized protein n=1 Tax=Neisseria meningitidis alpha522 TaxID=996307 RepID=I4E6S7_NEIME|nr:hypothetical protein N875_03085 [Neisseria meningitidis LNP21362]CCA45045.1 hypothetical protein NMALPHA522_1504 [Neisseria meningitidis alpha522]
MTAALSYWRNPNRPYVQTAFLFSDAGKTDGKNA